MKIALISTYAHPIALGLRYVSSFLKHHGHDVEMLFFSSKRRTDGAVFSQRLLDDCVDRLRSADLIGVSLMTNTFRRACVLSEAIRRAGIRSPIVWGGIHPTVAPQESIEVADIVCVGEGEQAMLELAEALEAGRDPTGIESLWFRRDGRVLRNPIRRLQANLDGLPFPDYDLQRHWVASDKGLVPARPENLRGALHRYRVETTRGCPNQCTFCNNAALLKVYKGKGKWVRKRSNEDVIAELETMIGRFATIEAVNIVDDLFFIRDEEDIDQFAQMYRQRINLPLEVDAFPNTISRRKVESLRRLPISLISMGIQSGCQKTLYEIYKRRTPIENIVRAIETFSQLNIRAEYHYIINNPYEPDENQIETMRFAATHHRGPAIVRVFPLQFYPGTPLYERAQADGLLGRGHELAYQCTYSGKLYYKASSYLGVWLSVVLGLRNRGVSSQAVHRLIDVVTAPAVRRVLDRPWFTPAAHLCYLVGRIIAKNIIYQLFIRPLRHLRRRRRSGQPHRQGQSALPRGGRLFGSRVIS